MLKIIFEIIEVKDGILVPTPRLNLKKSTDKEHAFGIKFINNYKKFQAKYSFANAEVRKKYNYKA